MGKFLIQIFSDPNLGESDDEDDDEYNILKSTERGGK